MAVLNFSYAELMRQEVCFIVDLLVIHNKINRVHKDGINGNSGNTAVKRF